MKHVVLALLLATSAFGLTIHDAFPLTDTHYGLVSGDYAYLASNGTDTFLFWTHNEYFAVTKVDGEKRVGRLLSANTRGFLLGVVWNGSTFIAAFSSGAGLSAQMLDRDAQPIGGPIVLGTASHGAVTLRGTTAIVVSTYPRLAFVEISPSGRVSEETVLSQEHHLPIAAASNGDGFAVAFRDSRGYGVIVLDAANRVIGERIVMTNSTLGGNVSIATDGRDYMLAVRNDDGEVTATAIGRDASLGRTLRLGTAELFGTPYVAWNGDEYAVAWSFRGVLRVAHVDPRAEIVTDARSGEDEGPRWDVAGACACNGRPQLLTRRPQLGYQAIDLATHATTPITYGAPSQHLLASASSTDGTLVVWAEEVDGEHSVHAGLRSPDGAWIQRELALSGSFVLATSNGHEFALVHKVEGINFGAHTFTIVRLDRNLRTVASAPLQVKHPYALASNGTDFAVLGVHTAGLVAERWSGTGAVTTSVVATAYTGWFEHATLASDGNGYLAAWQSITLPMQPVEVWPRTTVMPLRADLQPAAAQPALELWNVTYPALAWNGTHYVLVANERETDSGSVRLLTPAGAEVARRVLSRESDAEVLTIASSGNLTAIATPTEVSFLDRELRLLSRHAVARESDPQPQLAPMTNGRFAILTNPVRATAPHHGARRVMMGIGGNTSASKPDAPANVTVRRYNNQFRIEWTPPAQAVDGYRVEYKINDGQWLELGRWFDPDERVAPWPSVKTGTTYSFRVRAWSPAGTSAYSAVATASAVGKRRAVN